MSRKRPRSEPEKCKAELNINTKSANLTTFEEKLLNSRPQDLTDEQKSMRRKLQNRLAASRSRTSKRARTGSLSDLVVRMLGMIKNQDQDLHDMYLKEAFTIDSLSFAKLQLSNGEYPKPLNENGTLNEDDDVNSEGNEEEGHDDGETSDSSVQSTPSNSSSTASPVRKEYKVESSPESYSISPRLGLGGPSSGSYHPNMSPNNCLQAVSFAQPQVHGLNPQSMSQVTATNSFRNASLNNFPSQGTIGNTSMSAFNSSPSSNHVLTTPSFSGSGSPAHAHLYSQNPSPTHSNSSFVNNVVNNTLSMSTLSKQASKLMENSVPTSLSSHLSTYPFNNLGNNLTSSNLLVARTGAALSSAGNSGSTSGLGQNDPTSFQTSNRIPAQNFHLGMSTLNMNTLLSLIGRPTLPNKVN